MNTTSEITTKQINGINFVYDKGSLVYASEEKFASSDYNNLISLFNILAKRNKIQQMNNVGQQLRLEQENALRLHFQVMKEIESESPQVALDFDNLHNLFFAIWLMETAFQNCKKGDFITITNKVVEVETNYGSVIVFSDDSGTINIKAKKANDIFIMDMMQELNRLESIYHDVMNYWFSCPDLFVVIGEFDNE